jgi:integrase
VHPPRQANFRLVECLRSTDCLATQPTCFPCERAGGKQVEIRPPKYGSERTVYAPAGLMDMLSEHIRVYRPDGPDDRWLFPGEGEHPLHQNSVGYWWRRARGALGYRLHDLRHFYASGLIHAGCDVVTVQRALGHGTANVTLSTYSHLWPNADDRTRKAASALFDQANGRAYVVRTIKVKQAVEQVF